MHNKEPLKNVLLNRKRGGFPLISFKQRSKESSVFPVLEKLKEPAGFILPLILFVIIFILFPVLGTLFNSFFRDVTFLPRKFIWLSNFGQLLYDVDFWRSLKFTMFFVAVSVPLELGLGLFFAMVLSQPLPWRNFLRAAVLIPWAIPSAISARIWELIYNFNYGLANWMILKLGLSDQPINWLGTNAGAFFSIVIADAWKTAPFVAIIIMAGMTNIPKQLTEAAQLDGANLYQRFFYITLPLLRPVLVIAILFRTIDALRIFDLIYVLTNGGPGGATNSLSMFGYNYFLSGDFGYGSTISVVLFMIAFSLAILYVKAGRFSEEIKH